MPQPPDFDTNLEMNLFGPIPRPDGRLPSELRKESAQPSPHSDSSTTPSASGSGSGTAAAAAAASGAAKTTTTATAAQHIHNNNIPFKTGKNLLGPSPDEFIPPHMDDAVLYHGTPNMLGVLPAKRHDQGLGNTSTHSNSAANDHDTQAALTQLFVDPTLDSVGTGLNTSNNTLNSHNDDTQAIQVNPSDLDPQSENDHDGSDSHHSKKRRTGSSRANMLTRGGACEFCKKRKLKCTAELPSCSACIRAGKECVYAQKKQRSKVKILEDRLIELEKRLDSQGSDSSPSTHAAAQPIQAQHYQSDVANLAGDENGNGSGNGSTASGIASAGLDSLTAPTPGTAALIADLSGWERFSDIQTSGPESGFTFPGSEGELSWESLRLEPDLMTLADAAASDVVRENYPWEGMDEESISSEIVKACEGGKGIGEKIVAHLLQLYVNAQSIPFLHQTVDPETLISRLLPTSMFAPHPALLLALIPFLLPLSPSKSLSAPSSSAKITARIEAPGRLHSQHALATADLRVLDIIAAINIRTLTCYDGARLLEGWGEGAQGISLVWAAGLGKLGGAGLRILGAQAQGQAEDGLDVRMNQMRDKERKKRDLRYRGVLVPPAVDGKELGQRIILFWQVYLRDKAAGIGWNFPSGFDEEEITTPLPKENYKDPATLRDTTTMIDFLEGRANTGSMDTELCAQMKALYLLSKATRLYDVPSSVATPERTTSLKRLTRSYMASLPLVTNPNLGAKVGPRLQAWQMLYGTMMFLHLKEEIDAPIDSEEASESMTRAIDCAGKVVETVELLTRTGDAELLGYDILAVGTWSAVGKAVFKLAIWLEAKDEKDKLAKKLRKWGQILVQACRTIGKRSKFAALIGQSLENSAAGYDHTVGKYERTDFIP